ncbi:MAG: aldose 1-epimerase family protein [Clostridia bacterium]|nr:aldose 1-epimerase family protein [Clostridia bacterium]
MEIKTITIKNDEIKVDISTLGAEVVNVEKNGAKRIWEGKVEIWSGHSPILFPICSKLKDGTYEYNGKKYQMPSHGFTRRSVFEVVSEEKSSATFLLSSNEEIKKQYPFDFELRVHFKLDKNKLCVYYIVENKGSEVMYFNVGCHEAYAIDSELKNYSILFEGEDKIENTLFSERLLETDKSEILLKDNKLQLKMDYFNGEFMHNGVLCYNDSIIIENVKNKSVTLLKGEEPIIDVYFADFNHLVIWTGGEGFIAIEPWNGLPDTYNCSGKLKDKKAIDKVEPSSSKTFYHSIVFN